MTGLINRDTFRRCSGFAKSVYVHNNEAARRNLARHSKNTFASLVVQSNDNYQIRKI